MKRGAYRWLHRHPINTRAVFRLGAWLLENLPIRVSYAFTATVARLVYHFVRRDRRAWMRANLRQVLAHTRPELDERGRERELDRLLPRLYYNLSLFFTDYVLLGTHSREKRRFRFRAEGAVGRLLDDHRCGRGALVATAHIGNWYLGSVMLARLGLPVSLVLYPHHGSEVTRENLRRAFGVESIEVGDSAWSMLRVLEALREGRVVGILIDRYMQGRQIELPFFGKPAAFPTGPARIARLAGVSIYPGFVLQSGRWNYEASLLDPIDVRQEDGEAGERAAMERLVRALEGAVTRHPEVWFNFAPLWEAA